jgi:hypothetical protein
MYAGRAQDDSGRVPSIESVGEVIAFTLIAEVGDVAFAKSSISFTVPSARTLLRLVGANSEAESA